MQDRAASRLGPAPTDGRRFGNLSGPDVHGFGAALKWMLTRRRARWPRRLPPASAAPPPGRVDDGSIHATWIGHATVLLQVAGINILTDPMLSQTAGPLPWLGVKRVRDPAFSLAELPRIDLVLLSHNHYDHLDRPTLAALVGRDDPLILTGLGNGRSVPSGRAVELDWGGRHEAFGLRMTYVPAEHFSARGPFDRNVALWGGFVVESVPGRIYFAGDTGDGDHFAAIHRHFGPMTLSLIPIGAFEPRWFMKPVHIDPAEALAASLTLESQVSLAIHHGTFPLADDAIDAPPLLLAEALAFAAPASRGLDFRVPALGEPVVVVATEGNC